MILKQITVITLVTILSQIQGCLFGQTGGEAYREVLTQADTYFANGDLINAKASYQYASRLNPEDKYPKDKLQETLDKLRAKIVVVDQYTSVIAEADKLFRAKEFELAKLKYIEAGYILSDEAYPGEQIAEIDRLVREVEINQKIYNEAVANGDKLYKYRKYEKSRDEFVKANQVYPQEAYPKEKITELDSLITETTKIRSAYSETITSADRLFSLKYYENARQEYQKAADAKPDEDYPVMRIKEIDEILLKKNEFDQTITLADEFYTNKNLAEAKANYQAGLKIYPSENYPKDMIGKINESIRTTGNANELYLKSITEADLFLTEKDYVNAVIEFENAALIKPAESYPKQKIEEINELLKKSVAEELEYNQSIQRGGQYMANEDFKEAKGEFEKASLLRPDAAYPKEKLRAINLKLSELQAQQDSYDQIIALADKLFGEAKYELAKIEYQKALKLRPEEKYPSNRILEIDNLLNKGINAEKEYTESISNADGLFNLEQYEEAKLQYMKASYIKTKEEYPKTRMLAIDSIIMTRNNTLAEYNKNIAAGDRWMELKDYTLAKEKYNAALLIMPDEKYPKDKLVEIENLIVGNELAVQEAYNKLIEEGDMLFEKKEYDQAKIKYQNALKYKPEEPYPPLRITVVDSLARELDLLQDKYSVIIADADVLFKSKKYQEAKTKYIAASAMFPEEEYPKNKIEEINVHFKTSNQQNQQAYDKAIADADKFFAAGILDQALDTYRNARNLNSEETYPDEMIDRILKKLDENAIRDLAPAKVTIESNGEKKFPFEPVLVSDRKTNYLFIKATNKSEKEFKIVLSFGKGGTKNGGFMIPVPNQTEEKEFIIPIGKQYNWFSQDNDWISLVTQGGSVEISTVKISKGD